MPKIVYTDEIEGIALQFGYDTDLNTEAQIIIKTFQIWAREQFKGEPANLENVVQLTAAEPATPDPIQQDDTEPTAEPKAAKPRQRRKRRSAAEVAAEKEAIANGQDPQPPEDFAANIEEITGTVGAEVVGDAPTPAELADMVRSAIGAGTLDGDTLSEFLKAHADPKTGTVPKVTKLDDAGRAALATKLMETPDAG